MVGYGRTGVASVLDGRRFSPYSSVSLAHINCSIWEKKYGKNANHVKKQQAEEKSRPNAKGSRNPRDARDNGRKQFGKPQSKSRPERATKQQNQGQDAGWGQRAPTGQRPPPHFQGIALVTMWAIDVVRLIVYVRPTGEEE